ncbi:MAG TPA: hypothetical protein VGR98_24130 [Streptosporangiaceae bacterium]|nr:hypothetical protein [Streptosporangiaceae bacterium]
MAGTARGTAALPVTGSPSLPGKTPALTVNGRGRRDLAGIVGR